MTSRSYRSCFEIYDESIFARYAVERANFGQNVCEVMLTWGFGLDRISAIEELGLEYPPRFVNGFVQPRNMAQGELPNWLHRESDLC